MTSVRRVVALAFVTLLTVIPAVPGGTATGDPVLINEVLASHTGTDDTEYIELFGTPGQSLEGLSLIVVEGDVSGPGAIDRRIDFAASHQLGDNGFFLVGNPVGLSENYGVAPNDDLSTNFFENSSLTVALVETASLSGSSISGGETSLDAVALTDGDPGDVFYLDAPVIGPDGRFFPAGARRTTDGVDTDTAADWVISDFSLGSANTPTAGTGDTGGGPTPALISEIQGPGATSPLVGVTIEVEAVVVGDFEDGDADDRDLNGFFIQEEDGDADGDPATSEGVFVFNGSGASDVTSGDRVRVIGEVSEFFGQTEISADSVAVLETDVPLPTAAQVMLPLTERDDLEAYEGMLVTLPQELAILEYFNFDRFGEVVVGSGRQFQPTAVHDPLSPLAEALAEANALDRITIDDGRTSQNPDPAIHPGNGNEFDLTNRFRGGDLIAGIAGPLSYSFGLYRVMPTEYGTFTRVNDRPEAPGSVGGDLKVAAFNALNYFLTLDDGPDACGPNLDQGCRGADNEEERLRQRAKLLSAIEGFDADVVGLIEVENTRGVEPLADIVEGLNDRLGRNTYRYVAAGEDSVVGTDAIKVGLIYKPAEVQPIGETAILDDPAFLDPNDLGDDKNRAALAQSFVEKGTGERFTVVVNHLKSKGSPCGPGDDDPLAGSCNLTRTLAAEELLDWLGTYPTDIEDDDVLIVGDLNSYDEEDPIDVLLDAGYADLVEDYGGEFAYSYVFDGQLGHLDYIMSSASMTSQVTGATVWHINADEPDILDYDTSFKRPAQDDLYEENAYRSSDHDPVIIGLDLDSKPGRGLGRR